MLCVAVSGGRSFLPGWACLLDYRWDVLIMVVCGWPVAACRWVLSCAARDELISELVHIRSYVDTARKHGCNVHRRPAQRHDRQPMAPTHPGTHPNNQRRSPSVNEVNAYDPGGTE
jgi:hypothetical protein